MLYNSRNSETFNNKFLELEASLIEANKGVELTSGQKLKIPYIKH